MAITLNGPGYSLSLSSDGLAVALCPSRRRSQSCCLQLATLPLYVEKIKVGPNMWEAPRT